MCSRILNTIIDWWIFPAAVLIVFRKGSDLGNELIHLFYAMFPLFDRMSDSLFHPLCCYHMVVSIFCEGWSLDHWTTFLEMTSSEHMIVAAIAVFLTGWAWSHEIWNANRQIYFRFLIYKYFTVHNKVNTFCSNRSLSHATDWNSLINQSNTWPSFLRCIFDRFLAFCQFDFSFSYDPLSIDPCRLGSTINGSPCFRLFLFDLYFMICILQEQSCISNDEFHQSHFQRCFSCNQRWMVGFDWRLIDERARIALSEKICDWSNVFNWTNFDMFIWVFEVDYWHICMLYFPISAIEFSDSIWKTLLSYVSRMFKLL
jgi:hypothetical protein